MAVLQMSWQPSLLNYKRKSGPPLGLRNLGNTCYLNSVLQCLTYTPPLANFCLKSQHSSTCDSGGHPADRKECPFCILERRIARSLSTDLALDAPARIKNSLRIFGQNLGHGRQEDAHEFLLNVIDACHDTCLRLSKLQLQRKKGRKGEGGNEETIVREIFGGYLQSQVKCLSCGTESNKVDEMMDISVDILHSTSIKDALQKFFQPETLDGNNKYRCDTCKKLVAARKQMSILQAPNILVIHLKRFEGVFGGKVDKPIAFGEVLLLSSYMSKGAQDPHPEYRLFGTIVHSGVSQDSGHYYAFIKDAMGHWYCCNDSYVSTSTLQEVVSEKAYILFFTRSKQRPSLSKTGSLSNGSTCHQSNGSDSSGILRSGQSERAESTTVSGNHTGLNGSKASMLKAPSGPSMRLDIFDSGSRKNPTNGGIKFVVHKKETFEKTGNAAKSSDVQDGTKSLPTVSESNGVSKLGIDDDIDSEKGKLLSFANGRGGTGNGPGDSLYRGPHKDCVTNDNRLSRSSSDSKEPANGDVKQDSENSGVKRKSQVEDPCILLAKDAQSRSKVEAFKTVIRKEASEVLRSCGWSDEVFNFMHTRKKLCLGEARSSAMNILEMKRLLISDAKPSFIHKIPESLKGNLIQRLMLFSQQEEAMGS